jgi:hypothetical protein
MTWIIGMSVFHEGNSPVTISFTAETNPKGMLKIYPVVQTTGNAGDKIVPSPGGGVRLNITFDDLSDGIPRIAESLYRKPRKQRVAKRFYGRQQRLRFKTVRLSSFPSVSS